MAINTVARRYAQALFGLLGKDDLADAQTGLDALSQMLRHSAKLKHVLGSPVFTFGERSAVLISCSERAGCPVKMCRFFDQLLKKNRVGILSDIANAFREILDRQRGKQQVSIVSAQDVDTRTQQDYQSDLEEILSQPVELAFEIDPLLQSGIQIRIGNKVYDSTIRGQLQKIRSHLIKG